MMMLLLLLLLLLLFLGVVSQRGGACTQVLSKRE
jgi:hypothetical protein